LLFSVVASWMVKDELKERSRQGMTVLPSTHELSVAEEMADRIRIIHCGKLIAVGSRDELCRQRSAAGLPEDAFLALTTGEESACVRQ
jgi:ABC-2 type transport system ATP-binding protein